MSEDPRDRPSDKHLTPDARAAAKAEEFRMHAELAAIFEGPRKFDAVLRPGLDPDLARDVQRTIARLEKAKSPGIAILPAPAATADAERLLSVPQSQELPTNDYHIHRRPGETMVIRWLAGDEVQSFYARYQAHFDAAITAYRDEERSAQEWKNDPKTIAFLKAMDALELPTADRYLREPIRKHKVFALSTTTADEINIRYLCDYLMSVDPAELVGPASAPGDDATEQDLAWFFKLFALRGDVDGEERMCFFVYLQKAEDTFDIE